MIYVQSGRNNMFPREIDVWRTKENKLPEWLSDQAKVKMNSLGDLVLDTRRLYSGGIEILDSSGKYAIATMLTEDSCICFGDLKIFTLTENQLNLLYKKKNKKE